MLKCSLFVSSFTGNADASRVAVFLSHERDSRALKAVLNNDLSFSSVRTYDPRMTEHLQLGV